MGMGHRRAGLLSMANNGRDKQNSQFHIMTVAAPHLDGSHTVFGTVLEGMKVVRQIADLEIDNRIIDEEHFVWSQAPKKAVMIKDSGEIKGFKKFKDLTYRGEVNEEL